MNKRKIYGLITSFILLFVLAACGPVGKVPLDVMPTSTPTPAPVLEQVPLGLAPTSTLTPVPLLEQAPLDLAPPVCTPHEVSIDKVTSFCANQAAGLGGATFDYHPSLLLTINFISGVGVSCDYPADSNKVICSGPQNEKFEQVECTACRPPDAPDDTDAYSLATCANGYITDENGFCVADDPAQAYDLCPPGSQYNNSLQKCVDDGTGNFTPVCPPGFPYYVPNRHYCLAHPFPQVFNCQTFTVQLGGCKVGPNPPGGGNPGSGGSEISCPSETSWDAGMSCCINSDHRCQ